VASSAAAMRLVSGRSIGPWAADLLHPTPQAPLPEPDRHRGSGRDLPRAGHDLPRGQGADAVAAGQASQRAEALQPPGERLDRTSPPHRLAGRRVPEPPLELREESRRMAEGGAEALRAERALGARHALADLAAPP